jgi:hypothetical protein
MAGRRRGRGPHGTAKPRRDDARLARFEREVKQADDADQLAAAFDFFRSAARRHWRWDKVMHEMSVELYATGRRLAAETREAKDRAHLARRRH